MIDHLQGRLVRQLRLTELQLPVCDILGDIYNRSIEFVELFHQRITVTMLVSNFVLKCSQLVCFPVCI